MPRYFTGLRSCIGGRSSASDRIGNVYRAPQATNHLDEERMETPFPLSVFKNALWTALQTI